MPITTSDLNQLDAIRRRMLRSRVGWGRVHDEPWGKHDDSYERVSVCVCVWSAHTLSGRQPLEAPIFQ